MGRTRINNIPHYCDKHLVSGDATIFEGPDGQWEDNDAIGAAAGAGEDGGSSDELA